MSLGYWNNEIFQEENKIKIEKNKIINLEISDDTTAKENDHSILLIIKKNWITCM